MTKTVQRADVSVVIPCYNCESTILRAVRSVAYQSFLPIEVILINDCSTDSTYEVLHDINKEFEFLNISIINLAVNSGPASARNQGWKVAKGRYVAFLDSDDIWHPSKIEVQYRFMQENLNYDLSSHAWQIFDDSFGEVSVNHVLEIDNISKAKQLLSNRLATRSVMLKNEVKAAFMFPEGRYHAEDNFLWLHLIHAGYIAGRLQTTLAYSFKDTYITSGLSSNLKAMYKGQKLNYKALHKNKLIGGLKLRFLLVYAFIKYVRRIFVVLIKRPKC